MWILITILGPVPNSADTMAWGFFDFHFLKTESLHQDLDGGGIGLSWRVKEGRANTPARHVLGVKN